MTDRELPAGSLEWEEVKQLTGEDPVLQVPEPLPDLICFGSD